MRKRREATMKTLTLLLTLLLVPFAGAQGKYQTFGVGRSPGQAALFITGINDSGQVVGYRGSNGEAFVISPGDVWTNNIVKTDGGDGGPGPVMNNAATIAGDEASGRGPFYKLWGQPVQPFSLCTGDDRTAVTAINTAGVIAGNCPINIHRNQTGAFLANPPKGVFLTIPFPHDELPNDSYSANVSAVNNLNQIVGTWYNYSTPWSGFFYDSASNKLNTTFNMPGAVHTYPAAINDNQEVVGWWIDQNSVTHGFYWNPTAGFSDVDIAGDTEMALAGINNSSVILGGWQDANTPPGWHTVTIVNGQPTASIHVPHSQAGGTYGEEINNAGQVVGYYFTTEGVERGFIYTPSQ
jgi:probable HAF family extracellular repeat protein